jgi:hypothetical protein
MSGSFLRELKLQMNFMEFGGLSQTIYPGPRPTAGPPVAKYKLLTMRVAGLSGQRGIAGWVQCHAGPRAQRVGVDNG